MWVQSLAGEYPLEQEMVTHCNILSWKIPWTEEPGRLQSMGSQRLGHDEHVHIQITVVSDPVQEFYVFNS